MNHYFANPIYGGQDPFVCKGPDGLYYTVAEEPQSRQLAVFCSNRLTERGEKHIVFTAPDKGPSSHDLWAPELWFLRGKWYLYYAGASQEGQEHWDTHRMYVLEAEGPLGPYGPPVALELGDRMSIDGTVLELPDGSLYLAYMGRLPEYNALFLAPMDSPSHISGDPVMISKPDFPWEGDINEGPFPIIRDGKVRLLFAANAAHLPDYCLGLLTCRDPGRILDPESWVKEPEPVLTRWGQIIGPGHACMVKSPDNTEDWLVYHNKFTREETLPEGWNRVANLLRVSWDQEGRPVFEKPHAPGEPVPAPSGEIPPPAGERVNLDFTKDCGRLAEYGYSRAQTFFTESEGYRIDGTKWPDFGDKALIREAVWSDFTAVLAFRRLAGKGECGLLFRVSLPAAGKTRWRGYGLLAGENELSLVRCDGNRITALAKAPLPGKKRMLTLSVTALGEKLTVSSGGNILLEAEDGKYAQGACGVAAFDSQGLFSSLIVEPALAHVEFGAYAFTQSVSIS